MEYPWLTSEDMELRLHNFKGTLFPFQHKGGAFLYSLKKCLLVDKTGLGKTVQAIAAIDLLLVKYPKLKILVVTLASVQIQWKNEFAKFLPTIACEAIIGNKTERHKLYKSLENDELTCITVNYSQLLRDMVIKRGGGERFGGPLLSALSGKEYIVIFDEVQKAKNPNSKTGKCCFFLSKHSDGTKCLTATPIYNHLIDIYGIFKLINPKIFTNKQDFKKMFCHLSFNFTRWGTIVGYKNHHIIKNRINSYVFGRNKSEVAHELPDLLTKDVYITLPKWHRDLYNHILFKKEIETDQVLGLMVREQVCTNAAQLASESEGRKSHPKLDECVRIIEEELEGERTIVFSKFSKTIDILEKLLKNKEVSTYRITGKENQKERAKGVELFGAETGTSVLLITTAGGAGLNLQAANTLIMIDRPWSVGEVDQVRGRIHRIGTKHSSLLEINLIVSDTIDEYVLKTLRYKNKNIEKVFGVSDKPISTGDIIRCREELLKKLKRK